MTRALARLADVSYRYRGRMVLAWIAAAVLLIGVGSSLAGEFNAEYNTPGSESKAAADLTEKRFGGYSGQEIYVVAKDPAGFASPAAAARAPAAASSSRPRRSSTSTRTPRSASPENRQIASSTLPLTVPGWDATKSQGEQLISAADDNSGEGPRDQARRRPDLRRRSRSPAPRGSDSSAPRSSC